MRDNTTKKQQLANKVEILRLQSRIFFQSNHLSDSVAFDPILVYFSEEN